MGSQKNKNHVSDISTICRDGPLGRILNFGTLCDIADAITYAKFCDSRFRHFGVLIRGVSTA